MQTSFLRGVQRTNSAGVVLFYMIVPGHYDGRANHVHVMVRDNVTEYPNGTLSGNWGSPGVHHIGQLYFEEELRQKVERLEPYSSNHQQYVTNDQDAFEPSAASAAYDPFLNTPHSLAQILTVECSPGSQLVLIHRSMLEPPS